VTQRAAVRSLPSQAGITSARQKVDGLVVE
jgi:hypothetical protein